MIVIGVATYAFLPDKSSTQDINETLSSQTTKNSQSATKKSSKNKTNSIKNTTGSTYGEHNSGTETSAISQNSQNTSSANNRTSHGEISNGMDFSYRAAIQAGLIDDSVSRQEFYSNVQESGDGSFTYNGQTVYADIIHEGNPNGIYVNGEHYTDPDRFLIYTEQ